MKRCLRAIVAIALLAVASLTAQARYLQPDPLGVEGGGPNLYVYAGNDPVQNIDPDGLQFFPYSRNLNRTSLHPDKVPDSVARQMNAPYVLASGLGAMSVVVPPTLSALILGAPMATSACAAEPVRNALMECLLAGGCLAGQETTVVSDRQRTNHIEWESRNRPDGPFDFGKRK